MKSIIRKLLIFMPGLIAYFLLFYGAWLIYNPAGFLVAGGLLWLDLFIYSLRSK